jgi:hypothetical protein
LEDILHCCHSYAEPIDYRKMRESQRIRKYLWFSGEWKAAERERERERRRGASMAL